MNYVLLKTVKCKCMFTEAHLEPGRAFTMELFCEMQKMFPRRCLTGF